MGETDATAGAVQPTEGRKGFWFHEDGTLWWNDAVYVRADGVIPRACPRKHLEWMEAYLAEGHLDAAARMLGSKGTAWVLRRGVPEFDTRVEAVRAGLEKARGGAGTADRKLPPGDRGRLSNADMLPAIPWGM